MIANWTRLALQCWSMDRQKCRKGNWKIKFVWNTSNQDGQSYCCRQCLLFLILFGQFPIQATACVCCWEIFLGNLQLCPWGKWKHIVGSSAFLFMQFCWPFLHLILVLCMVVCRRSCLYNCIHPWLNSVHSRRHYDFQSLWLFNKCETQPSLMRNIIVSCRFIRWYCYTSL